MVFSEAEQASLVNFQQAMFSVRSKNVPHQAQHFPRPTYIPKEQIKLFWTLVSRSQPPREHHVSLQVSQEVNVLPLAVSRVKWDESGLQPWLGGSIN